MLAVVATLVGTLVLEAGFRMRMALEDRGLLTPDLELPPDPLPDHPAALVQIIRRSADPRMIYELRPNLRVLYEGALVTTNRHGQRGREHEPARKSGTFRIVGVGDSFMFGFGVADGETYLERLEDRLNSSHGSGHEVVNLAVPGYNGAMEVAALERKGLAFHPDLVIIEFVSNDFDLPNFIWLPRDPWTLRRSFLSAFVRERWGRLSGRFRPPRTGLTDAPWEGDLATGRFAGDRARVPSQYAALVGWEGYEAALRALARMAGQQGFSVVLLGWNAVPEEARVRELAGSLGFRVLDLQPRLARYLKRHGHAEYLGSPLAQGSANNHPSALGHDLIAQWLHACLLEERLLPRAGGAQDPTAWN